MTRSASNLVVAAALSDSGNAAQIKQIDLSISLIPIDCIQPHPLNPRPWSERYQARVHDEKVERLISILGHSGYDPSEPITVRQTDLGRYQIVMGHHRYCAMREIGHTTIPCTIIAKSLSATDAALMMLMRQGKAVEPWYAAEHAYQLCDVQGLKQADYAQATGYEVSVVNKWICAYRVRQHTKDKVLPVTTAALIARLPTADWQWVVTAIVERQWTSRRVEFAVKNLNANQIPPHCHHWLAPDKWRRKVWFDESGTLNREIANWIDTYEQSIQTIEAELPNLIDDPSGDEPLNPIALFDRLMAREPTPTQFKIELTKSAVIKTGRELLGLASSRPPVVSIDRTGIKIEPLVEHGSRLGNPEDCTPNPPTEPLTEFDVAILDLREFTELNLSQLCVRTNGRLLILINPLASYPLYVQLTALNWHLKEKLIWHRVSSDDRGCDKFRQTYDEILVCSQGEPDYFGYAQLRDTPKLERQTGNCFQIASKGAAIPPLLARLLITAYVPLGGSIYHHQTTDGTVAIAAQKLDRRGYWSSSAANCDEISLQILRG